MPAPAREFQFRGAKKTISAANSTVTWTGAEIQGTGVSEYVLMIDPLTSTTGNTFGDDAVEKVKLKAGADVLFDANFKQMQAWSRAYSHHAVTLMDGKKLLSIPLWFLDGVTNEQKYNCGFPPGLEPQLELTQGATAPDAAFDIYVGFWIARQVPEFAPQLVTQNPGLTAGGTNQQWNLTQDGLLRGLVVPTRGVDRLAVYLGGAKRFESLGPDASGEGDMIKGAQGIENGSLGLTYGDHFCLKFDTLEPLQSGADYALFDTDSSEFQTADEDNRLATYTVTRNG